MKIVVIGGTGLIGSKVVENLKALGHEAVPASPRLGIDTLTGKGLPEALAGASVVVDVSNSPSFEDSAVMNFFVTSTGNLLKAEMNAGAGHHVALSIVGIDRSPENGYFKAKLAQEALIEAGPIPFTIVRSTQFMEFVDGIADSATTGNEVHMAPVAFQPIAAVDVAQAVTDAAIAPPVNGRIEIAGPDRLRFDEVIGRKLSLRHDPRVVVSDPDAIYFGSAPGEDSLVPLNGARLGSIHYDEWLALPTTR